MSSIHIFFFYFAKPLGVIIRACSKWIQNHAVVSIYLGEGFYLRKSISDGVIKFVLRSYLIIGYRIHTHRGKHCSLVFRIPGLEYTGISSRCWIVSTMSLFLVQFFCHVYISDAP